MKASDVTLEMLGAREIRDSERLGPKQDWRGIDVPGSGNDNPRHCSQRVDEASRGGGHRCGRDAEFVIEKKHGLKFYCKQHLNGAKRSYAHEQNRLERDAKKANIERDVEARAEALNEKLGIDSVTKHYVFGYGSNRGHYAADVVEVSLTDLETLAEKLGEAQERAHRGCDVEVL